MAMMLLKFSLFLRFESFEKIQLKLFSGEKSKVFKPKIHLASSTTQMSLICNFLNNFLLISHISQTVKKLSKHHSNSPPNQERLKLI